MGKHINKKVMRNGIALAIASVAEAMRSTPDPDENVKRASIICTLVEVYNNIK